MTGKRIKIFFDGGCRPNPGRMEIAVVIGGVAHIEPDVGHGGSFDAEWLALIAAMRLAQARGLSDILLLGDSMSVVLQASGTARTRGDGAPYLSMLRTLVGDRPMPPIRAIKRSQNLAGIALAQRHGR